MSTNINNPIISNDIYIDNNNNNNNNRNSDLLSNASEFPSNQLKDLFLNNNSEFKQNNNCIYNIINIIFNINNVNSTIKDEIYYGIIQFISCLYILAVVPQQLSSAGYDSHASVCIVSLV